jgi:hypothetical protein
MENGTRKAIHELKIGETLQSDNGSTKVTSVFRFAGSNTSMVSIHGLVMSREHYVRYADKWIRAEEHPDAVPSPSIPELVCLNVENHRFIIANEHHRMIVADYDEHDGAEVIRQTQQVAIKALNGFTGETVSDYSLGIDENLEIKMIDGSWKKVCNIKIGETVWNAGTILGTVKEECKSTINVSGTHFSPAQIVFHSESGSWMRAGIQWPSSISNQSKILSSIMTSKCGTLHIRDSNREYYIRDYREVALPEMEAAYTSAFDKN